MEMRQPFEARRRAGIFCVAAPRQCHHIVCVAAPCTRSNWLPVRSIGITERTQSVFPSLYGLDSFSAPSALSFCTYVIRRHIVSRMVRVKGISPSTLDYREERNATRSPTSWGVNGMLKRCI